MKDTPNLWRRQSHDRHPELYEAEYAKQLERIARIRMSVSASLPKPPADPAPAGHTKPRPATPAPQRWDEAPHDIARLRPAPATATALPDDWPPARATPRDGTAHLRPPPPPPAARRAAERAFVAPAPPSPRDERRSGGGWAPPDHSRTSGHETAPAGPGRGAPRHRRRAGVAAALVAVLVGFASAFLLARDSEAPMVGTTFRLAGQPTGIAVSGTRVWVAGPAAGSVWILDANTGLQAAPALRTGGSPARVALTDSWAWIADTQSGTILRAATSGHRLIRAHSGGPDVTDVAVTEGAVWSTSSADGTVRVRESRGATRVLHVGSRPLALAADGRRVVAADTGAGTLVRLSAATRRVAAPPIRLGGEPVDVALVGERAWVVDSAAGTLQAVDVELGRVASPVALCTTPVAVAADLADVYVVCRGDRTLVRLDPSTGRVRERGRLAHSPTALALDPRHVWIAAGDHEVIRVDR